LNSATARSTAISFNISGCWCRGSFPFDCIEPFKGISRDKKVLFTYIHWTPGQLTDSLQQVPGKLVKNCYRFSRPKEK
jgi:hypothetical protein